jgi:hypothetical protein
MLDFLFGSSERELALLYSIVFTYCFEFLLFYDCINTSMYLYAIALVPLLIASQDKCKLSSTAPTPSMEGTFPMRRHAPYNRQL